MAWLRRPFSFRKSRISMKLSGAPSFGATMAQARSPVFGSGRPITATSATDGCV